RGRGPCISPGRRSSPGRPCREPRRGEERCDQGHDDGCSMAHRASCRARVELVAARILLSYVTGVLRRRSVNGCLARAAGGQESRERPRQRLEGPKVVDFFVGAAGEPSLGPVTGALGTYPVDLLLAL